MRVLGLMSGTSADGIDVALARVTGKGKKLRAQLEDFCTVPYPSEVRRAVLRIANAGPNRILSVAEISQLNFVLGELAADAIQRACRRFSVSLKRIDLIGSHGQTVYHRGRRGRFLGRQAASTLQLGEAAVIAERTGRPVVANFRPRDMAAGGQGAPLVPFVDYLLYRHPRRGRAALNIGGIANVTLIPPLASPGEVLAFDTGPGNMVVDGVIERATGGRQKFDRAGSLAARGRPREKVLRRLLRHPYFRRHPPKSAGREQFGGKYVDKVMSLLKGASTADKARTATELTVLSIRDAFDRFVPERMGIREVILGGGGVRNKFLVQRLCEVLPALNFIPAGELGVDEKAKEAFAFAVLAYQTWNGEPGALPSATGARHKVVLGCIVPGGKNQLSTA
jgi:anhydro-N-acetylmuramic acid kinase